MPSPFPGMDPYLERHWGDIHQRFITYAADQIQENLPSGLVARVEERVFVDSPRGREGFFIPDVRVLDRKKKKPKRSVSAGLALATPLIIPIQESISEGFIEIRDATSGHRVITVIELLSPTNKSPGPGQEEFITKREKLLEGKVSLVEIDLLRTGKRLLPFSLFRLSPRHQTPYLITVRRGWDLAKVEVYPVALEESLPSIAVPLRSTDEDVPLTIQAVLDQCYVRGRYAEDLDYRRNSEPPLEGDEERWANQVLIQAGLRVRPNRPGKRNGSAKKK